jgi:UDP-N-acetylmuramate: L-alanyl-gamma-D-glutamyl-meso-diaminopimelate ligase
MILHVLNHYGIKTDYMVGAQLEGFEVMVKMSDEAEIMVLEGDEYLTSALDRRPKFHVYKPDIALISGIAWDHINVFPTFEIYVDQFRIFAGLISKGGILIYNEEDEEVKKIGEQNRANITRIPYAIPDHTIENGATFIQHEGQRFPLKVFGDHNLLNMNGARLVCNQLGVNDTQFFAAIRFFAGASKRLEIVAEATGVTVFKDFAHSPSKLNATTFAVKKQFPERKLVACIELHTYSSLSEAFLSHYSGCLDAADIAKVYFNPHAIKLKRLPDLSTEKVKNAFNNPVVEVYTNAEKLRKDLLDVHWEQANLLMMSSGNFDDINIDQLGKEITSGH